jgi:tRNA 2-thiouridine synthesizing protein B
MAILHLVNRSPLESRTLEHCLARLGKEDSVLLIENAVYGAVGTGAGPALSKSLAAGFRVYVLNPDLEIRGLASSTLLEGIHPVDYAGFVGLTVAHRLIQSWF